MWGSAGSSGSADVAGSDDPRPVEDELLPEIRREIDQVAHFGSAKRVKELVAAAARASDSGDFEEAIEHLTQAKTKDPRSVHVRELLGLAYYQLERWREAARELAAYRRLSGKSDRDPEYADCERALGRPEKALEILNGLQRAEVSEEVYLEATIVAAGALTDLGRADEAVRLLEAGPIRPDVVEDHHLRAWYALADALEVCGRRADARGWWDAIYAEDPEFFDVGRRRLGLKS